MDLRYLESDDFHPQDGGVEVCGFPDVPDRQNQVVQMADLYRTRAAEADPSRTIEYGRLYKRKQDTF